MTSNNTEQRLRVTYSHDDEFIIPHGIDLNDDTQVEYHFVKWNTLHIKLKSGTSYEIEAEGNGETDYKYPADEEIVDIEIEPTDFTPPKPDDEEPEVTISHTEYCCRIGDDINKNMSEESIKNLDPPPVKHNGEWVCFACADALHDWELIPESEDDPIPPYDGDGCDTKCFNCNATGCDGWMTKGEDKHPVHMDCFA
jgi:hypothetical protein